MKYFWSFLIWIVVSGICELPCYGSEIPLPTHQWKRDIDSNRLENTPLGSLADPAKLEFQGNTSFRDDTIRAGLAWDMEFVKTACWTGNREDYRKTVENRLALGYRRAGFPAARISAAWNTNGSSLNVKIVEGDRYHTGEIRISGNQQVSSAKLIESLTTTNKASILNAWHWGGSVKDREKDFSASYWEPESEVNFDAGALKDTSNLVKAVYFSCGYLNPSIDIQLVPDEETKTATLMIRILDEGYAAIIDDIQITGLERNTPQELLDLVDLKEGEALDLTRLVEAVRRLKESGRFSTQVLSWSESPKTDEGVSVQIQVKEIPEIRVLSEEWSPEEKSFLKLRQWIFDFPASGKDFVLHGSITSNLLVDAAFSPQDGVIITLEIPQNPTTRYTLLLKRGVVQILTDNANPQLLEIPSGQIISTLKIVPISDVTTNDRTYQAQLGAGFSSKESTTNMPPFVFQTELSPAPFVSLPHKTNNSSIAYGKNTISLSNQSFTIQFDRHTGEIEDLSIYLDKTSQEPLCGLFEVGAFARRVNDFESKANKLNNAFDRSRPISSLAEVFLTQTPFLQFILAKDVEEDAETADILLSILNSEGLSPLDQIVVKNISNEEPFVTSSLPEDPKNPISYGIGFALLTFSPKLLPWSSWPCSLSRGGGAMLCDQSGVFMQELTSLAQREDVGPIASYAIARLLSGQGRVGAVFCKKGLSTLTPKSALKDIDFLLDERTPASQSFVSLLESLSALSVDQRGRLLEALRLEEADVAAMESGFQVLAARRNTGSLQQAARAAFSYYWETSFKASLKKKLIKLSQPSSLHQSAMECDTKTAKRMIEDEADVNQQLSSGNAPLYIAAGSGCFDIVKLLIEHGAHVNHTNTSGQSALHFACQEGHLPIVEFLLEHDADINAISSDGMTPLHFAVMKDSQDVLQFLLPLSVDLNTENSDGQTPLGLATKKRSKKCIRVLTEAGGRQKSVEDPPPPSLFKAALICDIKMANQMIAEGADVNQQLSRGNALLFMAAGSGCFDIVKLLVAHGAHVNHINKSGQSALHYACEMGHLPIVEFLLEHDADINAISNAGRTPLHFAVIKDSPDVLQFLLPLSPNLNMEDSDGQTPLDLATKKRSKKCIRVLTEANRNQVLSNPLSSPALIGEPDETNPLQNEPHSAADGAH